MIAAGEIGARGRGGRRRLLAGTAIPALAACALTLAACGGSSAARSGLIVYEARPQAGDSGVPAYTAPAGDDGHYTHVYTADPRTGATKQISDGDHNDGTPAWAPGGRIIFKSDRDGAPGRDDLYTMRADGSDVRRLTETPDRSEWTPKYSPDGTTVAYIQVVPGTGSFLALMAADGSDQRQVAGPYPFAEFPAWTRDGAQVYFAAIGRGHNDADILRYDVASGAIAPAVASPAADVCPHFTHDGRTLTYASMAPGADGTNVDLFAHDLASPNAATPASDTRLTADPGVDDYGNPSPDDSQIVFISKRGASADLWIMDRDGSHQRPLAETPGLDENVPDW